MSRNGEWREGREGRCLLCFCLRSVCRHLLTTPPPSLSHLNNNKNSTEFALSPSFYPSSTSTSTSSTSTRSKHPPLPKKREGGREEEGTGTDPFSLALEALQFNVHRLAISPAAVGVDVSELFGKEAVLLNLWAIQRQAARVVEAYEGLPDVPLPRLKERRRGGREETGGGGQQQQYHQQQQQEVAYQQYQQQVQQQQQQQQGVEGTPRVVFEDREESEWSLVELQNQVDALGGGGGGGQRR